MPLNLTWVTFSATEGQVHPGQVKRHSLPFQVEAVVKYLVVPLTFALDCRSYIEYTGTGGLSMMAVIHTETSTDDLDRQVTLILLLVCYLPCQARSGAGVIGAWPATLLRIAKTMDVRVNPALVDNTSRR